MQRQKEKGQRSNTNLQNITQKTKNKAKRTPLNTRGELRCSGGKAFPPPHTCGTCRDTLVTNLMISHACQQIG
jgi:hypothetical protein